MQKAIKKYVEQLKKQLEKETDTSHIDYLKTTIEALSEQEETEKNISPKAKEYIERLNDISYDIDKFIDLTMHGQIKNNVEDIEKEMLKEEINYKYIEAEISLERAIEEIENAVECIKEMY